MVCEILVNDKSWKLPNKVKIIIWSRKFCKLDDIMCKIEGSVK
jgi:hypothetical protein